MSYKQGVNRDQVILLPEMVDDYVAENNPVRFIEVFVEKLNLKELEFLHAGRENQKVKGHPI